MKSYIIAIVLMVSIISLGNTSVFAQNTTTITYTNESLRVAVNYDLSRDQMDQMLNQMIQSGHYIAADRFVLNKAVHFEAYSSVSGKMPRNVEITLFHFNRKISASDALVEMKKRGFRPATLIEFLCLGASVDANYGTFELINPAVSLGQYWQDPNERSGRLSAAELSWDQSSRSLKVVPIKNEYPGNYRFAAVKK